MNRKPKDGSKVRFQMPIEDIDNGTVISTDGSYCMIEIDIPDHGPIIIERYWECEVEYV